MQSGSLGTSLTLLRAMALAASVALPALVGPSSAAEVPHDSLPQESLIEDRVDLVAPQKQPTRITIDADGHTIHRYGDADRLGRLVDKARVGPGLDDARVIRHRPSATGDRGYAVMAGKDHPTDLLTVPLAAISGVESPELLKPGAENYFADAWKDGRRQAAEALGTQIGQLPRSAIALAVNSQGGRSQDRLHIHADLLDPVLGKQLKEQLNQGKFPSGHWTTLSPIHGNHQYRALWVEGKELEENPFLLVHDQLVRERGKEYADTHMGQHSIAVVGETDANGREGFLILDGRYGNDSQMTNGPHDSGSSEEWLWGHAHTPR